MKTYKHPHKVRTNTLLSRKCLCNVQLHCVQYTTVLTQIEIKWKITRTCLKITSRINVYITGQWIVSGFQCFIIHVPAIEINGKYVYMGQQLKTKWYSKVSRKLILSCFITGTIKHKILTRIYLTAQIPYILCRLIMSVIFEVF